MVRSNRYEHGLTCFALFLQWPKRVLDCVGAAVTVTWLLSVNCQFIRRLMRLVYPESAIPAEYEVDSLLKPVHRDFSTIDESLYQLHFGQYFRYDVRTQLPFFYRSVQKLLGVICTELVGT